MKITPEHIDKTIELLLREIVPEADEITLKNQRILLAWISGAGGLDDLRPYFYPNTWFRAVSMMLYNVYQIPQ